MKLGDAGDITAGMIEIRDKADLHSIAGRREHQGDRVGYLLHGKICRGIGNDHRDLEPYEIGGKRREAAVVALRPAILDGDVLAVDNAAFLQAVAE